MKYLFIILFVLTFALFDTSIGYTSNSPLYTHFTYIFQHASIIHLLFNSLAFIGMYTTLESFLNRWVFIGATFTIASIASFIDIAIHPDRLLPTVGASSVIYAMIGLYIGVTLFFKNIKIADTRKYLLFISCVILALIVSLVKENSNFTIHIYSLVLGFILSLPISGWKNEW